MLKTISYKNITIKQAENLVKSEYFTEIICDGDNKTIGVAEKEYIEAEKKIRKMLDDIMKPVAEVFEGIAKTLSEISADVVDITKKIVDGVFKVINSNWNKKISKKKFIKLLQSNGIQRNDINKIVSILNKNEEYLAEQENRVPKKFPKLHPHSFRHTFATRCFEKNLKPVFIMSIMGHSNYETTLSYTHLLKKSNDQQVSLAGSFV